MSLPTVPVGSVSAWDVLESHVESMSLGLGAVPSLDEAGRCLVLALHALTSGSGSGQPIDDLRRARVAASATSWDEAARLAAMLDADDLFRAGVATVEGNTAVLTSARAKLFVSGAPSAAFGLQRLSETRLSALPWAIWREVFPTAGFMRRSDPGRAGGRAGLIWSYCRRWVRIARQVPPAATTWFQAHRTRR